MVDVALTAEELREDIGDNIPLAMAERLLSAAIVKVEAYAPGAPVELKTEAVIRFAGYLGGSDFGGVQSESIGPRSVTYTSRRVSTPPCSATFGAQLPC